MFEYRKMKPHLLNTNSCSEEHIHVIHCIKKLQSFLLKACLLLLLKRVSHSQCWGNKLHGLLGRYENSQLKSTQILTLKHIEVTCYRPHTKQWVSFEKLATLQWINFLRAKVCPTQWWQGQCPSSVNIILRHEELVHGCDDTCYHTRWEACCQNDTKSPLWAAFSKKARWQMDQKSSFMVILIPPFCWFNRSWVSLGLGLTVLGIVLLTTMQLFPRLLQENWFGRYASRYCLFKTFCKKGIDFGRQWKLSK